MSYFSTARRRFLQLGLMATAGVLWGRRAAAMRLTAGWLELKQLKGEAVVQLRDRQRMKAWEGLRLQQPGDWFETEDATKAVFELDSGIGKLYVVENSALKLKAIARTASGARLTDLEVLHGQVRLALRSFNNSESRLRLVSPASMTEVTGTEFGITVQPDGTTGVATESGTVEVTAEGQTVIVESQQQTRIVPGLPPQPVVPLMDSTELLMERAEHSGEWLYLEGVMDPMNLLVVDGVLHTVGAEGRFDIRLNVAEQDSVILRVTTPLGQRRVYRIPLDQAEADARR